MDLGIEALKIKNLLESSPLKFRFLVRGLTVSGDGNQTEIPAVSVRVGVVAFHIFFRQAVRQPSEPGKGVPKKGCFPAIAAFGQQLGNCDSYCES